MAGCYCTQEEREGIAYLTRNGMTVALIAATELTNGIPRPEGEVGVLLLNEDRELILQKLETAAQNADFVILSLHWGIEGSGYYTDGQRELAQLLAEAGADLILGHHPHVLQGGEYLETSRGRSYVAYSLGNFISAQRGAENMLAGFLQVELEKAPHGERAEIRGVNFIPTVTHYGPGYQEVSVWPLSQYTPELAAAHGVRQYAPAFGWDYLTEQLAGLPGGRGAGQNLPIRKETVAIHESSEPKDQGYFLHRHRCVFLFGDERFCASGGGSALGAKELFPQPGGHVLRRPDSL